MHERQVQTPLWPALQLDHERFVRAPALPPRRFTLADVLRKVSKHGCCDMRRRMRPVQERVQTVVKVGQEEDFAVREGVDEGGLIYAVERARLDRADPIQDKRGHQRLTG